MERMPTNGKAEPVEFESLEARLLLAAAPLIQPDGPMPQAAEPGCGPSVEVIRIQDDTNNPQVSPDVLSDSPGEGEAAGEQSGYALVQHARLRCREPSGRNVQR